MPVVLCPSLFSNFNFELSYPPPPSPLNNIRCRQFVFRPITFAIPISSTNMEPIPLETDIWIMVLYVDDFVYSWVSINLTKFCTRVTLKFKSSDLKDIVLFQCTACVLNGSLIKPSITRCPLGETKIQQRDTVCRRKSSPRNSRNDMNKFCYWLSEQ